MIIGTRGSKLALKQVEITKQALLAVQPDLQIEVTIIKTEGDVNSNPIPIDVVGKGWFTKEIEECLLNGSIDIAVHSLKDMPESLPPGLQIGAYLDREDPRDVLVSNGNLTLSELPPGAIIGTDSARRRVQIHAMRSDVVVTSIRGNVPTRIEKLSGEYDAVVLAAAGIKRLGLEDRVAQFFDFDEIIPSPGQGVLAVEIRTHDAEISKLIFAINDSEVMLCAQAERAFAKAAGGGCKSPTGAYAVIEGDEMVLKGMLQIQDATAPDTFTIARDSIRGDLQDAIALGTQLAKRMLENV